MLQDSGPFCSVGENSTIMTVLSVKSTLLLLSYVAILVLMNCHCYYIVIPVHAKHSFEDDI
jgi:hypothetical protein